MNDQRDIGLAGFVLSIAAIIALFVLAGSGVVALLGLPVRSYLPVLIAWPLIGFLMLWRLEGPRSR